MNKEQFISDIKKITNTKRHLIGKDGSFIFFNNKKGIHYRINENIIKKYKHKKDSDNYVSWMYESNHLIPLKKLYKILTTTLEYYKDNNDTKS